MLDVICLIVVILQAVEYWLRTRAVDGRRD